MDEPAARYHIVAHVPLLCAVTGVVLTMLALNRWFTANSGLVVLNFITVSLTLLVLIATLLYIVFELLKLFRAARKERYAAYTLLSSVFSASLLSSLAALAIASASGQGLYFSGIALVLSFLSLMGLLLFMMVPLPQSAAKPAMRPYPVPTYRASAPALPLYEHTSSIAEVPVEAHAAPAVRLTAPASLPPLFQDDLLYALPQPRMARFFSSTKLPNDSTVLNEDACMISPDETRFALCDGASNSSLPRPWAALLGQQWIEQPFFRRGMNEVELREWLKGPRLRWARWVRQVWWPTVNDRNRLTGDYPVSEEQVREIVLRGASATLLGVMIDHERSLWRATAIGDTCLFVVGRDAASSELEMLGCFPFASSADFTQTPSLLSSRDDGNLERLIPHIHSGKGPFGEGTVLFLATDALAKWLLQQIEQRHSEWRALLSFKDQKSFVQFVEEQRERGSLEEDDTTLIVIPFSSRSIARKRETR